MRKQRGRRCECCFECDHLCWRQSTEQHLLSKLKDERSLQAQEEEEAKVLAEFQETFGVSQEQVDTKPQRLKPGVRTTCPVADLAVV
jgi:hypothetical protein